MLERKPDMPREDGGGNIAADAQRSSRPMQRGARQSEFAVSRGGMNQESRHNKSAPRKD